MRVAAFLLIATWACAQEPAAILELGGAGERSGYGPTLAAEVTPIEHWLELEAGTTALYKRHSREWSADLLFKKPWTLSEKVEFMAGIGPEFTAKGVAGEAALDFMFWPWASRRFGLYLEPGYDYSFGRGHERSFGASAGLLIPIGKRR